MNAQDRGAEPAYPWGEHGTVLGGLTKREAFAMAALKGILANPGDLYRGNAINNYTPTDVADMAIEYAEALLNRLSLTQEPRT